MLTDLVNTYHIINGDCLAEIFPKNWEDEILVWRDSLLDGPSYDENSWENRNSYYQNNFSIFDFREKVFDVYQKILAIPENSEVNFWFGNDLFCLANLTFLIQNLKDKNLILYRILPQNHTCKIFTTLKEKDFLIAYENKVEFQKSDFEFADHFFNSIKTKSFCAREFQTNNKAFPQTQKYLEYLGKFLDSEFKKEIIESQMKFEEFTQKYQEFGLGDTQFKNWIA